MPLPRAQYKGMRYLDIGLLSPTGLRIMRGRVSARLFCWLADHAPRVAEAWALRRWPWA